MPGRLFLVHWKRVEAEALAAPLRAAGWEVGIEAEDGARAGKLTAADPPDVIVIYLRRLPSHGRETARWLRTRAATRGIPLIFVDGRDEPLAKTKALLPDARYVTAAGLPDALASFMPTGQ